MGRFFTVLGRLVVRFRYLVVAFWLVLVVITAGFPSLSSEVNNDNSQFLPASTPSSQAATLAAPHPRVGQPQQRGRDRGGPRRRPP